MSNIYIVDVSGHNGHVDWGALKAKGVTGAIVKIIRKDLNPDKRFYENVKALHALKMPWGVYNYTYATTVSKAISDANLYCDMLDKVDKTYFKLGAWCDIENDLQKKLSKTENADILNAAQKTVESRGYTFGVYTGMSFAGTYLDASKINTKNWWIARYYADKTPFKYCEAPNMAYRPTMPKNVIAWQYTSHCKTNGTMDVTDSDQSVLFTYPTAPTKKVVAQTPQEKVIEIARAEEGYLEKKSAVNLDSKTANAGSSNYTKYARDLQLWTGEKSIYPNGQPWCDMFVDWVFIKAFGVKRTKEMLGGWSAYTPTSANYFKKMGRWHSSPRAGDQIFFKNSTRICHTGIVYKVENGRVYTVEGNTSGASGVIANGGGVHQKSYDLSYSRIAGYGRPDYSIAMASVPVPKKNVATTKHGYSGVFPSLPPRGYFQEGDGTKTLKDYPTQIKRVQAFIKWAVAPKLVIDGHYGGQTETAVKAFQKAAGFQKKEQDGKFGKKTLAAAKAYKK